jgi:Rap1a immunity proteins
MCFGAITALMNLEPFFKPEFAMCPPQGSRISYSQMVSVIAAYLRNHPEKLHENFHLLVALALHLAWPCPEGGR